MKTHTPPRQDNDLMPADILGGVIAALFYITLIIGAGLTIGIASMARKLNPGQWLYLACVAFIVPSLIKLMIHLAYWKP